MISKQLQQGKAAEHLVCADLILQGCSAFLADAGLPYDVIADDGQRLIRIQVKSTMKTISTVKSREIYRFHMRCAKGATRRMSDLDVDMVAFVALDIREIAYLDVEQARARSGGLKLMMEFRSNQKQYPATTRPGGLSTMRNIQDFPFCSRRRL